MNQTAKEYHFLIEKDQQTLLDSLVEQTQLSKNTLKDALQKGAVWLKQPPSKKIRRFRRGKKTLSTGTEVFFYYDPILLASKIPSPKLIADHQDFSIWYKPKGVLSQGSKWADHTTLTRWIETQYIFEDGHRKAILLHRLDKATDGLMIIAHNKTVTAEFTKAFDQRQLQKNYQAWVIGQFPETEQQYNLPIDDKTALTIAQRLTYDEVQNRSLLSIQLKTGRKHQIRRHLSQAGFPIVGDRLYGSGEHQQDLQLTAVSLSFNLKDQQFSFRLPASLIPSREIALLSGFTDNTINTDQ